MEGSNVSQSDDQEKQRVKFASIFMTKTRDEWAEIFRHLDACVTPVLDMKEAAEFPHNKEKGTYRIEAHGNLQAAPAPHLSRSEGVKDSRPLPKMGQHTFSVLSDFNFHSDEIKSLLQEGVLMEESKL